MYRAGKIMKTSLKKPIYLKLVDFLKNYIQKNMKKDQKLMSERDIATRLNISRYTVRQALNELEKMGYIYKIHGKGTFISEKSVPTALNDIYSFTEQMKSLGKIPETNLLEFKVFNSDELIASKLNLSLGEKVIKLKYLRIADNIPMMIERTYLPFYKFSTLTINELNRNPLYTIMKNNFNQNVYIVNEALQASSITSNDAALLKVENNTPCLKVKRVSTNKTHDPIEYTLCIARSDQFVYNYKYIHQD